MKVPFLDEVRDSTGGRGVAPRNRWPRQRLLDRDQLKHYAAQVRAMTDAVAQTVDEDLRAHHIALAYNRCARLLDRLLAPDDEAEPDQHPGVSWFAFGTWATATISRDIRNTRPPARLAGGPLPNPRRLLAPLAMRGRVADGQRVGRALSWAQRLVFISTCFTFAELLERIEPGPGGWHAHDVTDAVDKAVRPYQPENAKEGRFLQSDRHLTVLAHAFGRYHAVCCETEGADLRARRVYLANLTITAVEQDVVDPAVALVVDHVPRWLFGRSDAWLARVGDRWASVPRQITEWSLPQRQAAVRSDLVELWARLMTDQLLVLALPCETLRLGRDIPPLRLGGAFFPPPLARLDRFTDGRKPDADELELLDMVAAFDRSRGEGFGTAARDWRRYDERMNWATTMLRSRQQDRSLLWAPYTELDQERLEDGGYPERDGDPIQYEIEPPLGWPTAQEA